MKTFRTLSLASLVALGTGLAGCASVPPTTALDLCTTAVATVATLQDTALSAKGQADLAVAAPLVSAACPVVNGQVTVAAGITQAQLNTVIVPQVIAILAEKL